TLSSILADRVATDDLEVSGLVRWARGRLAETDGDFAQAMIEYSEGFERFDQSNSALLLAWLGASTCSGHRLFGVALALGDLEAAEQWGQRTLALARRRNAVFVAQNLSTSMALL